MNQILGMVSINKIAKIAKKKKVSMDYTLEFGESCYEAGMIEILKGIAMNELHFSPQRKLSSSGEEASKILDEKYENLKNILDEDKQKVLLDYDDAFNNFSSIENTDEFIDGFIKGYRFLKNQVEFLKLND